VQQGKITMLTLDVMQWLSCENKMRVHGTGELCLAFTFHV